MNHLKKYGIGLGIAVALSCPSWAAESKPALPLNDYLQQLQVKLDHTAQRVNKPTDGSTAVAGLRGSKQGKSALYWKGAKGSQRVNVAEVKAYRDAVEQARAGKRAEAIASLNSFQETYPKSPLLSDVQDTLHRLSQEPAPAAAPSPASVPGMAPAATAKS